LYCRLLDDLDSQARNAQDRVSWARAACKIAVHLARQGQVDEAHALILRVRETFGVELHHEIAPWVMLAEGVIHYFRLDMKMSWERLRRAYALAVGLKMESARSACAAWMAVIAYERSDLDSLSKFLLETFEASDVKDHHSRGRACMVLAAAIHLAGSYELARRWYDKTRLHAAAEGDQAMISAMLFNVASCRATNILIEDVFGDVSDKELLRADMEVGSFRTYDSAVGAISFEQLTPLVRGQLLVVGKKYPQALAMLETIDPNKLPTRDVAMWLASRAWCYANLEDQHQALSFADRAIDRKSVV
jgi:tetratricopeptide (TPR) repeat protein